MHNKKGESLVEVIVALGILTFIFMGVVNIIASSITLNVSSRQRTEGVAMVQKKLNEYLAGNTNNGFCSIVGRTTTALVANTLEGAVGCNTETLTNSSQTCYWVEVAYLNSDPDIGPKENLLPGYDAQAHNFIKVVSHGKWFTRILGEQEFEISRVIRNI